MKTAQQENHVSHEKGNELKNCALGNDLMWGRDKVVHDASMCNRVGSRGRGGRFLHRTYLSARDCPSPVLLKLTGSEEPTLRKLLFGERGMFCQLRIY